MEPTPVSQIKGKNSKVVQSPETENAYRIRKLSVGDYQAAGLAALFSIADPKKAGSERSVDMAFDFNVMIPAVGKLVALGVLEPKISVDESALASADVVHVSELGGDEMWLFGEICSYSGLLDQAARQQVKAYAKNVNGSESSMESPGGTASSRTGSSSSGPESSASPSTH